MSTYWLTNVRLESGFEFEGGSVIGTQTELCHLLVENGVISRIAPAAEAPESGIEQLDAKGLLLLPPFKEMHIHIDKTYYSGPWKAVRPATKGIFTRIEEEKELLPKLLPTAADRAARMLELLLSHGSTHVRTHCNVDRAIGLKHVEMLQEVFASFEGRLTHEIVAFPQHGLLLSDAAPLIREALRQGAGLVGGVDPANVDGNVEKSLHTMMELAVEADADIDLHLHDGGSLGIFTIKRLAALTEEAGWQGRVTISHAFALGDASSPQAELAERLASLGIGITTSVPMGPVIPPVPLLRDKGVSVSLGTDSINDHWSPFGNGDNLEKAGRLAERFGWSGERQLAGALAHITGGVTPLDAAGSRVWPAVGADASGVLVEAGCSAEAVARRAKRRAVLHRGSVVSGAL
ncbi:amidohydrolase [Paenibacillus sp. MBLB4367]|uniref:amidohydrolase n=1 Tax=Paenibacillus sp. MBLB4367 TaxID=3384767 RepID=UPI003908267F